MKHLVIGILAHVDSGKTTLSEAMLYHAGELRSLGRVDHGNAFLDTDVLEKERGITIFAKQAELQLEDLHLTLLDTPGHVDFSTEAERVLQVLDAAILVVSGTDGIQSHTMTLWRLLRRYQVPTFVFVNKMDLAGADKDAVLSQLKQKFSDGMFDAARVMEADVQEELGMCSEALMNLALEGGPEAKWQEAIAEAVTGQQAFPVLFGSALKLEGVEALFTALKNWRLAPEPRKNFGARVFKITQDAQGNRLTHLKVTGGTLRVKDMISAKDGSWQEKVNAIRIYSGAKFQVVEEVAAGTVCTVTGLTQTKAGMALGVEEESHAPMVEPVMTYRVILPEGTDITKALALFRSLEEEDPQLRVVLNSALQEIHVQLMGDIQLEVLTHRMAQRGLDITFDHGRILYRETIAKAVEGIGHYEPLRHYAEVHLVLEPGEPGSGLRLATSCPTDEFDLNWQRLVLTHLAEKTHRGVLTGAPITDMKITLIAGRAHLKHTEGGDFRQATYRALRQGLRSTESVLLEPWYRFRLEVPSENIGRALSDMERFGAEYEAPETLGGMTVLEGRAPVITMQGYPAEVRSYTHGKGNLFCAADGYRPCHNTDQVVAEVGYDADSDVENTADSVFCSHGSGSIVKWYDVPKQAHIQTNWGKPVPEPEPLVAPRRRSADYYRNSVELDKELMAIFERTYGPVKRDKQKERAVRPPEKEWRPKREEPTGENYLLVDGYNIIFAWEDLNALAKESLDVARTRLADMLCNYRGWNGGELILVFDAYKVKNNPGEQENYHGIHIVYTREAETADMYIEKVTHDLSKHHSVRVATSDGLEQMIILGHGALRMSARMLREEVDATMKAIQQALEDQD